MYKTEKYKWKVFFYEHYYEVPEQVKLKAKRKKLKAVKDMKFLYENLYRSFIFDLPSLETVRWKMVKRGKLQKLAQKRNGKVEVIYEHNSTQTSVLDGQSYLIKVYSKALKKQHTFQFSNPERYVKLYPELDELMYINEILKIIKSEFNIW